MQIHHTHTQAHTHAHTRTHMKVVWGYAVSEGFWEEPPVCVTSQRVDRLEWQVYTNATSAAQYRTVGFRGNNGPVSGDTQRPAHLCQTWKKQFQVPENRTLIKKKNILGSTVLQTARGNSFDIKWILILDYTLQSETDRTLKTALLDMQLSFFIFLSCITPLCWGITMGLITHFLHFPQSGNSPQI